MEEARERAREVGLAGAGRAEEEDVRLRAEHVLLIAGLARADALVVVVDGDRQRALRAVLPDHPGVEEVVDLAGLRQRRRRGLRGLGAELLLDDLVAQLDALVADVHAGAADELPNLLLALPAERALEQFGSVGQSSHGSSASSGAQVRACCRPAYGRPNSGAMRRAASFEHPPRRLDGSDRIPEIPMSQALRCAWQFP